MSEANGKVCCSCRNCERRKEGENIRTYCKVDGHYIGYIECFEHWCRHWTRDRAMHDKDAE